MLFASYSRADSATVDALVSVLEQNGYEVWIDRADIEGGTEWRSEIVAAIETCEAFLLILSHNSIASRNVRREIDVAEAADRQVIPVMIEQLTLPPELRYQLSSIQMIEMPDLSHQRLSVLIRALGGAEAKPVEKQKRASVDLSSGSGGGFLGRIASGKLFGRKKG